MICQLGIIKNIERHLSSDRFTYVKGNITSEEDFQQALEGVATIFHFAAQPDVKLSTKEPKLDFEINMVGRMTLLESMRKIDINRIVFASSGGTVYDDSETVPETL